MLPYIKADIKKYRISIKTDLVEVEKLKYLKQVFADPVF